MLTHPPPPTGTGPRVGQTAPNFEVSQVGGGRVSLAELRGKVVLVDFFGTWCGPCRMEAPGVARVYREYRGKGVEFIGVAVNDTEGAVRQYRQQMGIEYPLAVGSEQLAQQWRITGVPTHFFLGRRGQIAGIHVGSTTPESIRQQLDKLLAAG